MANIHEMIDGDHEWALIDYDYHLMRRSGRFSKEKNFARFNKAFSCSREMNPAHIDQNSITNNIGCRIFDFRPQSWRDRE